MLVALQVITQRMAKLKPKGSAAARRPPAEVLLRLPAVGPNAKTEVLARGHLDEVQELKRGGVKFSGTDGC